MPQAEARSQGSTEYLLIVVVVLIVAATAIFFLTGTTPGAIITGTAENSGDNVAFTPSSEMTPRTIPAVDWEYAVYRDATEIAGFTAGTAYLNRGETISLPVPDATVADILKIRYKEKDVFNIQIG